LLPPHFLSPPAQHPPSTPSLGPSFTAAPRTRGNWLGAVFNPVPSAFPSQGPMPAAGPARAAAPGQTLGRLMDLPRPGRLAPASIIYKAGRVSHWQPGGVWGRRLYTHTHTHTLTLSHNHTLTPSSHPAQRVTTAGKGARGAGSRRDVRVSSLIQVTHLTPSREELGLLLPVIPCPPNSALFPHDALSPWGVSQGNCHPAAAQQQRAAVQPRGTCTACHHHTPGHPQGGDRSKPGPSRSAGRQMVPVVSLVLAWPRCHVGMHPCPGDIFVPRRFTTTEGVPGRGSLHAHVTSGGDTAGMDQGDIHALGCPMWGAQPPPAHPAAGGGTPAFQPMLW